MRDGLCALLAAEEDFEVVGAIVVTPDAVRAPSTPAPDIAVIDFSLASRAGLETVAAVRKRWLSVHIVLLTARKDDQLIDAALHEGIEGFVLKTDGRAELMSAIRTISQGKRYLTPSIANQVVSGYIENHHGPSSQRRNGPEILTEREREVMRLIASGFRTREIAEQLSLSHKTIEKHRSNLMRKLGLRSATAVAAYAIAHGYVTL
jgi:DNA-binding NarL/FixJ family response regulator